MILDGAVISCGPKDDDDNKNSSFDRTLRLQNPGNRLILPLYQNFEARARTLQNLSNTFINSVNELNLLALQGPGMKLVRLGNIRYP